MMLPKYYIHTGSRTHISNTQDLAADADAVDRAWGIRRRQRRICTIDKYEYDC